MSLETRIPKEINDYQEKIVFGLSGRQLASLAAAIATVGLAAFFLWYLLGINFAIVEYILILLAMPFIAFGFIRYKGMTFEKYAMIRLRFRFGAKRLLNKTDLDFLPSLYPMNSQVALRIGARREAKKKEKRRRKHGRECLDAGPARRRRSRAQAKRQNHAARREAAEKELEQAFRASTGKDDSELSGL